MTPTASRAPTREAWCARRSSRRSPATRAWRSSRPPSQGTRAPRSPLPEARASLCYGRGEGRIRATSAPTSETGPRAPAHTRHAKLSAMRMPRERQVDAAGLRLRKQLRVMSEQHGGHTLGTALERAIQVIARGPRVIHAGDVQAALAALHHHALV